jgi:hypothetical protein
MAPTVLLGVGGSCHFLALSISAALTFFGTFLRQGKKVQMSKNSKQQLIRFIANAKLNVYFLHLKKSSNCN